jgi:hypothetical protein
VQQRGSLALTSVDLSSSLSVMGGGNAVVTGCGGQLTSLTVTNSSFSASATTLGGSISLSNAGSVMLEDATFAEGAELTVGGGTSLSLTGCGGQLTSLTVTDSSFSAASAITLGGSISLSNAGWVMLEDATFAEGAELTVGGGTSLSLSRVDVPADVLAHTQPLSTAPAGSAVRLSEVTVTTTDGTQWPQLQPGTLVASTDPDGALTLDPPAVSIFGWFFPVRPLTT